MLALLAGWVGGLIAFTYLEHRALIGCSAHGLKARSENMDRTGAALVPISISVAIVSLLVCLLETPKHNGSDISSNLLFAAHFALVFAAVGASWLFVQTAFGVRYAHIYCTELARNRHLLEFKPLSFPGGEEPDGHDMLHFSIVIGAATATADVNIQSKKLRRLASVHTIYSYFFNACVLALIINLSAAALA